MEQQLLEQVTIRLNQLEDMQKQIADTTQELEKQRKNRHTFFVDWQNSCKHAYYKIQHQSVYTPITVGYRCCLCQKYLEAKIPPKDMELYNRSSPKRREAMSDEKGPPCIGTHLEGIYVLPSPLAIPPERQAEVDEKKEELAKIDTKIASLEENLHLLQEAIVPIKKELEDIKHLLVPHFNPSVPIYGQLYEYPDEPPSCFD